MSSDCTTSIQEGSAFGPARMRLRRVKSASFATGSASAFLVFASLLSFAPDRVPSDKIAAWQLRGSLAWRPSPAVVPTPPVAAGMRAA